MRERALKVVMVLVGLLFVAGMYPVVDSLRHVNAGDRGDMGDDMMLSLYVTLGVFLLLAVRNPGAHRSLIGFAAWSSFAHAIVMSTLGFEVPSERAGFLGGSAVLVVIGAVLLWLLPGKEQREEVAVGNAGAKAPIA
jgi:hypothetical protein